MERKPDTQYLGIRLIFDGFGGSGLHGNVYDAAGFI